MYLAGFLLQPGELVCLCTKLRMAVRGMNDIFRRKSLMRGSLESTGYMWAHNLCEIIDPRVASEYFHCEVNSTPLGDKKQIVNRFCTFSRLITYSTPRVHLRQALHIKVFESETGQSNPLCSSRMHASSHYIITVAIYRF